MKKKPQDLTGRNEKYLKKMLENLQIRVKDLEDNMKTIKKHFDYYIKF